MAFIQGCFTNGLFNAFCGELHLTRFAGVVNLVIIGGGFLYMKPN